MARIRSVYPAICEDQQLANVSAAAERTFVRLWTHLDDDGRCEDRPKLIAARLYPEHDDMDASALDRDLNELAKNGLLIRYEVDGKRYISAKPQTWAKYQKPKHPKPSELPSPDMGNHVPETGEDVPESLHVDVGVEGDVDVVGEGVSPAKRIDADFQTFWDIYPRHHGTGKPGGGAPKNQTLEKWKRLTDDDRSDCLVAVVNYAHAMTLPDAPYPAMATTWLNQKRWQDWQEPADISQARGPSPPKDRFAEMAQRFQGREEVRDGQADWFADETRRSLPAGSRP